MFDFIVNCSLVYLGIAGSKTTIKIQTYMHSWVVLALNLWIPSSFDFDFNVEAKV